MLPDCSSFVTSTVVFYCLLYLINRLRFWCHCASRHQLRFPTFRSRFCFFLYYLFSCIWQIYMTSINQKIYFFINENVFYKVFFDSVINTLFITYKNKLIEKSSCSWDSQIASSDLLNACIDKLWKNSLTAFFEIVLSPSKKRST